MGIKVIIEGSEIELQDKQSLLEAIRLAGIQLTTPCGGKGRCGKCLVKISPADALDKPTSREAELLEQEDLLQGYRLACQTFPAEGITVSIPEESRELTIELLLKHARIKEIEERALTIESLEPPDISNREDFIEYLSGIAGKKDAENLFKDEELGKLLGGNKILAWYDARELVAISPKEEKRIGIALDIGSTTMVVYAFDILSQEIVAVESITNPQRAYGEDMMTRIDLYTRDPAKDQLLKKTLQEGVLELLRVLTRKIGMEIEDIVRLTFVGNTAMHHFFLGLNVTNLGKVPFSPDRKDLVELSGTETALPGLDRATISAPPLIAGFIGADLVAVLLATDLLESPVPTAAIDIGTNAEIALAANGRLMSCSAAAGPAFEGGNISHGMRATNGAICGIWTEDGQLKYETIGNNDPIGLCGSGLIDFISEGLRLGIVDSAGSFVRECCGDRLIGRHGKARYLLFSDGRREVSVTQGDVRQLQLAKAAISAGLQILMEKLRVEKLEKLLLAGAFGANMSARSGRFIGMLPELPLDQIVPVGNAAGTGAIQLLTDIRARRRVLEIAGRTEYVELSEEKDFQRKFIAALDFPHSDLSKYPESSRLIKKKIKRA